MLTSELDIYIYIYILDVLYRLVSNQNRDVSASGFCLSSGKIIEVCCVVSTGLSQFLSNAPNSKFHEFLLRSGDEIRGTFRINCL